MHLIYGGLSGERTHKDRDEVNGPTLDLICEENATCWKWKLVSVDELFVRGKRVSLYVYYNGENEN